MKELLQRISKPLEEELVVFEEVFKSSLSSEVKIINTIVNYITRKKGKQFRPRLCLLSAKLCGAINQDSYKIASLIEILHVATLIHDDVVDSADLRRGFPSVNRIWKSKLSVLIGDYLFSKSLINMAEVDNMKTIKILASLASRLSQGEILQIEKAMEKKMDEKTYFKMISDKTASLFSCSCQLGAMTTSENQNEIIALSDFGELLGQAYQIKDDLFDIVGNIDNIGKPSGYDLKRNMLTLPLIYIFDKKASIQKMQLRVKLKTFIKRNNLKGIRDLIISEGGIDYAESKLKDISQQAEEKLDIFENSDIKTSLLLALKFNIERKF